MQKVSKFNFRLQKYLGRTLRLSLLLVFLSAPLFFCEQSQAMNMDLGKGLTLDLDVSLKYSGGIRVEDQDSDLLSDANGDDGNRNFDQGDLINNKFSTIIDMDLNRDNIGAFVRGKAFYDFAYDGKNANDSAATNNNMTQYGGLLTDTQDFSDKTKDRHRDDVELLDAYAYGMFDLGGRTLDVKVGRQVVNWGESLFIANGVGSAQSYLDGTAANVPGTEIKELYLPSGQVYAQIDATPAISFAAFYQWEWEPTRMDEVGSYFSTKDILDEAGQRILPVAGSDISINRGNDKDADDDGQFGISMRYFAEELNNGVEFGFHFINYHEKTPMLKSQYGGGTFSPTAQALGGVANPGTVLPPNFLFPGHPGTTANTTPYWGNRMVDTGTALGMQPLGWVDANMGSNNAAALNATDTSSYYLEYAEDVKLYGLSIGTNIGDTNVGCEFTYRQDYPVAVPVAQTVAPMRIGWNLEDVFQAQVSAIHSFGRGPMNLWDAWMIMGEVGFNRVLGMSDEDLIYDTFAWGGTAKVIFDYYYILPNLDLKIPFTYKFNPEGNSSVGTTFVENADSINVGLDFTYKTVYQFGVAYTNYIGSSADNTKVDRDFVGFYAKYSF